MDEIYLNPLEINHTLKGKEQTLFREIRQLIESAKQRASIAINAKITTLYWQVGDQFLLIQGFYTG